MKKSLKCIVILSLCGTLSGCAAVVASSAATGILVAQDRRTTGTIVEDQSIELKARQAVTNTLREEEKAHVSTISYNNNVLLIGQAPTDELRDKVEQAVKDVAKVRSIHNEIIVAAPTSVMTRSSDGWITTKIKSEMTLHRNLNPTRVKVITEDGIVYLLGIVKPDEEEIAVNIARHTKGVKRVVKMFEYLPS
jgi:osmotically-inducible protein OsmY